VTDPTFVQGNTAPAITATLHDEDDPTIVLDLSTATGVRFQMRRPDDRRFTVNAAAVIVDALAGKVAYAWSANDLAVPGDYDVQWEVTFNDGKVQTTAHPNRITVRRQ